MKLLLASSNTATTPYPVYPLGMGIIAAALQAAGHEAVLFDILQAELSLDAWRTALRQHSPGLVGISIRNLDNVNLLSEKRYTSIVCDMVRLAHEEIGVPVVLGGSGFSLLPEVLLKLTGADYGIAGEGEQLIVQLVAALEQGSAPPPGTVFRGPAHIRGDDIRSAWYEPTILQHYLGRGSVVPVQTKRGCNLRCSYCSYPVLEGGAFRVRPAVDVVDDLERLVKDHGIPFIFFADSLFNDDGGAYLDLLREMKRRNLSVPWSAFLKPTGITDATVDLMRQTGLAAAELGSDAATDATLRGLNKPFRFADVIRANDVLMRHNIATAHYFMFGGPNETPQTVAEGIVNIQNLRCTAAFVFLGIRILPHTTLHEIAIRDNIVTTDCDLLEPVYYVSPAIDRQWTEAALTDGFKRLNHVVFPPDTMDEKLQLLHKLGYAGSLWELLGPANTA